MKFLTVYQIYFHPDQLATLEQEYIPYYNNDCTVFFENDIIRKLITEQKHIGSEYFGVVSHKLREKIGDIMKTKWAGHPNISNHSTNEFTPELFEAELEKHRPDVMSFQRHHRHDPISFADKFHPYFSAYFKIIMDKIGYAWKPTNLEDVFYCNFFVAKCSIYERFVMDMLGPAIDVMKNMESLNRNSHYPHALPEELKTKFNLDHYPYHPFLCERMFSYYVSLHGLKALHY